MTRVTSQKTRQAILTVGDAVDVDMPPDKLQLFDEAGNPLTFGAGFLRYTQVETTAVLAPRQIAPVDLELYPSVRIWKISTNRPARVRAYPTSTQRDLDLARSVGLKPPSNISRLFEIVTGPTLSEIYLSPTVDISVADLEDPKFYASVTNLDGVTAAIAVTYYFFRTE